MNALLRTALAGVALGVAATSAFAATPTDIRINKAQLYCGIYDTLVRLSPSHKYAIVKNHCGQIRFVPCRDYYVTAFGLDSGYRNTCMVRYKVESPRL